MIVPEAAGSPGRIVLAWLGDTARQRRGETAASAKKNPQASVR
jgi:hypothetical protein